MVEWNPVAGMEEISVDDIRDGDVIIQYLDRSYTEYTCVNGMTFSKHGKYYLLSHEIREPEGRGDLVGIYRTKLKGTEGQEVEFFIRARDKSQDEGAKFDKPWTDENNSTTFSWEDILERVDRHQAIRIYTANYKMI